MIAVVGLLVILVGGISVAGTIGFLSSQGGAEVVGEGGEVVDGAVPGVEGVEIEGDGGVRAASSGGVDVGLGLEENEVAVGSSGSGGEDGGDEESGTTGAAVVEVPPGGTSGGAEDEDIIVIEDDGDEVTPSSESKPKRPMYETSGCARVREEARAAKSARDWKTLLARTKKRWCWSGAEQKLRLRLQVGALLESKRFGECIKVGRRSKDTEIQRKVSVCEKMAAG